MQPLMVTNLGAIPRYVPYRPAARPMPYAPAPVSPRPFLTGGAKPRRQLGAFTIEELPSSAIIAGASVGAFYFSGLLPTPWDMVVKGVSAAGVGYALYRLFAPPGPESNPNEPGVTAGPPSPIARASDFDLVTASFVTPTMYSKVSLSGWWTQTYAVQLLVSYGLADSPAARAEQKPVTFSLQIDATEAPYYPWGKGDPVSGNVGKKQVVLNPGDQQTIDFNPSMVSTKVFSSTAVTLTAYKQRVGGVGREKMTTVTFFIGVI